MSRQETKFNRNSVYINRNSVYIKLTCKSGEFVFVKFKISVSDVWARINCFYSRKLS